MPHNVFNSSVLGSRTFGTLTLIDNPSEETVEDVDQKLYARIDTTSDDTLVTSLNTRAREYIEDKLELSFVDTTWTLSFDCFPNEIDRGTGRQFFEIYRTPLSSVTSIQFVDVDGNTQTLATTEFDVDLLKQPARIIRSDGAVWPELASVPNAITITFVAGFGAAADVPEKFKELVQIYFNHLYEHRELAVDRTWSEVPMHIQSMIDQYRIRSLR